MKRFSMKEEQTPRGPVNMMVESKDGCFVLYTEVKALERRLMRCVNCGSHERKQGDDS